MTRYVRIVPELRAAHLKRISSWGRNETVLFAKLKWDITLGDELPENCHRLTMGSIYQASRSSSLTVEVPEPLWIREIPRSIYTILIFKLMSAGRARFVTYAIENNSLDRLLRPRILRGAMRYVIGKFFGCALSRIAYGSTSSRATYRSIPEMRRVVNECFIELPPTRTDLDADPARSGALFVGRIEERKGIFDLLKAWETVEDQGLGHLLIVGDGSRADLIQRWANASPKTRMYQRHVDHSKLDTIYAAHRVLVAPSRRDGRWREQIGLPIKEALSQGLTVVTTSETGLAEWLRSAGHVVLDNPDERELADGIAQAIRAPLDPAEVVASLPERDGREEADRWLKEIPI